jgi:hypothetical protein
MPDTPARLADMTHRSSSVNSLARVSIASVAALALATAGLLAEQQRGAAVLTDKQRKSLAEMAEPWPDAATVAKRKADADHRRLFESSEPFEFTLAADFKAIQRDRDPGSTALYPATLTAPGIDGQPVTLQVQIRNRGILRRNPRTCAFPPLRIEFERDDKGDLRRSLFDGLKHIKLATHCQGDYDQYVLREYLAYRTYNVITPWSLRVRLARADYVDSGSGRTIATQPAFFLEREEDMARRMEGRQLDVPRTSFENHDMDALTRAALFGFLVGNTDYSIFTLHNVFLVQAEDRKLRTVLYDFDLTGLVNPPYGGPSRTFGLASVKDRLYRGPCRTADEIEPLLAEFRSKKEAVLQLYADQKDLDRNSKQDMKAYVEEFFDIITDKGRTKRKLVDTCNKGVW